MARKLDAKAASFSPSFGVPPPQQDQHRQDVGASASGGGAAASNKASAQERSSHSQGKSPPSALETNGRKTPATRGTGGQSRGGRNDSDCSSSNRSASTARSPHTAGGRGGGGDRVDGGGRGRGGGRGARRRRGDSSGDAPATDAASTAPSRRNNADGGGRRSVSGTGGGRGGSGGSSNSRSSDSLASAPSGGNTGKGRGKGGSAKGGNANHLLNFQFQPISSAAHQGEGGGGRARRGSGGGGGPGRNKAAGGGVWGGGSTRGPMSKEQFLQANFHFLLHDSARPKGGASPASPVLQEAFFDPDVLVDWDTVDTVRLFRKVSKAKEALPSSGKKSVPAAPQPSRAATNPAIRTPASDAPSAASSGGSTIAPREASSPELGGLAAVPALEEISWGSGKKRRDSASSKAKAAAGPKPPVQQLQAAPDERVAGVGPNANGAPSGGGGLQEDEEEEAEDGERRCSICLGMPIVPRVTKCGHGPFCLVCILRHLNGEASARCPLCFDKMHRSQLRRVACRNVRPYAQGGGASLLLLQRERSSLVPTIRSYASREDVVGGGAAIVPRGSKSHVPGGGVKVEGSTGEGRWASGICPEEGDQSEMFSRLVRAKPSTLRDFAAAEQFALLSFRHGSIQSGETEWIPYVSEAQALVNAQLERYSYLPLSSPAATSKASSGRGPREQRAAAAAVEDDRVGSAPMPGTLADSTTSPKPAVVDSSACAAGTTAGSSSGDVDKPGAGTAESGSITADAGASTADAVVTSEAGLFRFFQSCDGQKAFLHPLNMRQLLDDSEKGLPLPDRIDAKVYEVETVKLTPELRRRLPFLSHLPIHCDVSFLEVDMAGLVSEETAHKFREEIQKRERKRRGRAAQEARAAKKEARLEQDRTDRIAAMRDFTVDLQGPTPGGVESPRPPPPSSASAPATNQDPGSSEGEGSGVEVSGPSAAAAASAAGTGSGGDGKSGAPSSRGGLHRGESAGAADAAARGNGQEATGWSFARVTAMNGHFPTLKPSAEGGSGCVSTSSSSRRAVGAWGASAADEGGSGREGRAWGAKDDEPLRGETLDALGDGRPTAERESGATQAGKKKGRKGKSVSLFSNAGVRGGAR